MVRLVAGTGGGCTDTVAIWPGASVPVVGETAYTAPASCGIATVHVSEADDPFAIAKVCAAACAPHATCPKFKVAGDEAAAEAPAEKEGA